jgi:hypothetical protein
VNRNLTSLVWAKPSALDEFDWLTPSPRKVRKTRIAAYGRTALVLSLLAAPQLARFDFTSHPASGGGGKGTGATTRAHVIDAPFAPRSLRRLSTQDAEVWNAKIPDNPLATRPALPFALGAQGTSFARSLECLTAAVYYEAGSESIDGERAVAQVVLNRARHPEYPHTVCGVVFQGAERRTGCQFSFTCDGSMSRVPTPSGWQRAQSVAAAALAGSVYAPVGWSTHYHADYVVPYWAQSLQKLATIGHHIFYRWSGAAGEAASFTSAIRGAEPDIALLHPDAATVPVDPLAPGEIKTVTTGERPIIASGAQPLPLPDPRAAALAPGAPAAAIGAKPAARPTAAPDKTPDKAPEKAPAPSPLPAERWIIGAPKTQ